jgi:tetratricopeptide (TPR) repeat protein
VLEQALAADDVEAASVAERVLGLTARELSDVEAARLHFQRAIGHAERGGLAARAAEARLSLAVELVAEGRGVAALRELGKASRELGTDHPQIHAQLALVYARLGRYDHAHDSNAVALASAERRGDTTRVALILANQALVQCFRGEHAAAERDLRRALALCESLGQQFAVLDTTHNLAWVLGRRGRLPEALALFDQAETGLAEQGAQLAQYQLDRAEVLLLAGRATEAGALAAAAARELDEDGQEGHLPEGLLLQARAAILAGNDAEAAVSAADAARQFAVQDRAAWAAVARAVEVQARARRPTAAVVGDATTLAAELSERGLQDEEEDVRLAGGAAALAVGDPAAAEELLTPLAALRRSRAARRRTRAWQAELLLRRSRGDRRGALTAATAALRALDDSRAGLGATDLHAAAAVHGATVARQGLELALAGSAADVLRWSELSRASTLQHAPVRPPDDSVLAGDLERLRTVTARRQQALLDGEPSAALYREQLDLEEAVRRRSRHAQSDRGAGVMPTMARIRAGLDHRRVVSLFDSGGRLHALLLTPRRSRVVDVCASGAAELELRHLRLALRRAVLGHPGGSDAVATSSHRLVALLDPAFAGEGDLVIVPTPQLAAVPWTLLDAVAPYDVQVTPSLALWCRRHGGRAAGPRIAVAGPDLPEAATEVAAIAALDPTVLCLTGQAATAAEVLAAIDGAHLAHLACHGHFRADNPMFSSLRLADGPLTVYDLERLTTAPEHVVLSACDSARLGQELLGLAAAFFALGTRTLIASVVPVDDVESRALMVALHEHWRAGADPTRALRAAQRQQPGPTAAAFVCLTAGAAAPAQTVSG